MAVTMEHETADIVVWEPGHELNRLEEALRVPGKVPFTHHNSVERAKLSRDEQHLVGVLAGRLFTLDLNRPELGITWSSDLGASVGAFTDHDISPDGQWIASADFGARVTIHRFEDPGEVVARLAGYPRSYDTAVAFGREGRRLYIGNEDGRVRVWDAATWSEIPEEGFVAHHSAITAIAVSHEGSLIATSRGYRLKLFPIEPEPG